MKTAPVVNDPVWVVVKVSRGLVDEARVFSEEAKARDVCEEWCNEDGYNDDYDEVDIVKTAFEGRTTKPSDEDKAALEAIIEAYEEALTVHIFDEQNGEAVPASERRLVAKARRALARLRADR